MLRLRDYRETLPGPGDVLLLIEFSETTPRYDREVKLPLYARSGIPEVWIVDLTGEALERHTGPPESGYRRTEKARRGESIPSEAVPDLILRVEDVLAGRKRAERGGAPGAEMPPPRIRPTRPRAGPA